MNGLIFRRLRVDRLLGITQSYELRGLAAGVNLVFGPNASGKTTTARALEALLWPQEAPYGALLDATAELDGALYAIRLDAGLVDIQRDGVPATLPTASAEARDRYRLWLPDLLRDLDTDFAGRILIESSGGFDLRKAARALEPRRPSHRQRREQTELRQARERVRTATEAEKALGAESRTLAAKEERLARRGELSHRLHQCQLAAERIARQRELAEARERLRAYPETVARLRGDEAERIEELRRRITQTETEKSRAEIARSQAAEALRNVRVPEGLLGTDLLARLDADLARAVELERDVAELERQRAASEARLAEEEAALGPVDADHLGPLDLAALGDLNAAITRVEDLAAQRRAFEAELHALPEETPPPDIERLETGALLLRQWQGSATSLADTERLRRLALAGAAALVVVAFLAAVAGVIWLAILVIAAAAALLAGVLRVPRTTDPRADRQREYLDLGLIEAPEKWEPEAVQACLSRLTDRISRARDLERARERRRQLALRLDELDRRWPAAEKAARELAGRFGLELPADTIRFGWLVDHLSRWQRARAERVAAGKSLDEAVRSLREVLAAANERLETIDIEPVRDARSLRGTVERLRHDLTSHEQLARELQQAEAACLREDGELTRLRAEIDGIFARIELSPSEEHRLTDWCAMVGRYRDDTLAAQVAEQQVLQLDARIREIADFDDALLAMSPEALGGERENLEREIAALDDLAQEVGSLRARIEAARQSHALEDALTEERAREDSLRELRLRELRHAVADLLVEYVARETSTGHLPQVFHRANELFKTVTRHAYELRVHDADAGSFRAYDTRTERSYGLEELSSGTRVQLLLAVRLAFAEALEAGVALPILMDETLANSDDQRAAAIMEAVVQLAASGRQVFYFTAQLDEVDKWRRLLAERRDVEWKEIDLAEVRSLENRLDPAAIEVTRTALPTISIPDGLTHADFPRFVPVPAIDVHQPAGALHLWYLIEKPEILRYVLADLRLSTWGELRSLLTSGGAPYFEDVWTARIHGLGDIAATVLARLRVGRGRRVDRQVLVASGAVSDRFIDEIAELCEKVQGDAARLLELLESRAVPNFRTRSLEALREYFEVEGYLDQRTPLGYETIRRQILAEKAGELASGRVGIGEMERLMVRLMTGAGVPLDSSPFQPVQAQLFPDL